MKNRKNESNVKKLSLNKMTISKINNLSVIKRGDDSDDKKQTCAFPDNASKPPQGPVRL